MRIGIIGTGVVGNTLGAKLVELGNEVMMGSRTANNEKAVAWVNAAGKGAAQGTFAEAAKFGEIVFNCTGGMVSLEALKQTGAGNLEGKILIDVCNALDFSKGMPPTLSVVNDNSMGEEIQKHYPGTLVVKALNTMNCKVMVNPGAVAGGDHHLFMCGNDAAAKQKVKTLLQTFGWKEENFIDLGDITGSRGMEQLLPIWIRLMSTMGTAMFQFKIAK